MHRQKPLGLTLRNLVRVEVLVQQPHKPTKRRPKTYILFKPFLLILPGRPLGIEFTDSLSNSDFSAACFSRSFRMSARSALKPLAFRQMLSLGPLSSSSFCSPPPFGLFPAFSHQAVPVVQRLVDVPVLFAGLKNAIVLLLFPSALSRPGVHTSFNCSRRTCAPWA